MPKYLFIYHGGRTPETQEEGAKMLAAWRAWYEGLGDATIDPGNPVGQSHTVSANGHVPNGGPNPASGYSIIEFPDYDAACAAAAKNPIVGDEGSVEVAEIHEI